MPETQSKVVTVRPKRWPENKRKFKELVLYIAQKCADDPAFGSTMLNKVLCFSDFLAYAEFGEPITGFMYQRLPEGPAPKRLVPIRDEMMKKSPPELGLQEVKRGTHTQKRPVNLRSPNLDVFTAKEIALIDQVIEAFRGKHAKAVSDISHAVLKGWAVVRDGEEIPYETIFLSTEPLTKADVLRGREVAKEHGLLKEA